MAVPRLNAEGVEQSLEQMVAMLASDGYGLDVKVESDRLVLTVLAGPDACRECLVPKEILASVATNMLQKSNIPVDPARVEISYPVDYEGH
jgi:hypothetical protein